jgi:predicted membrane protein
MKYPYVISNIEEEKNILTEELSTQYSQNNISLGEYERLIEYVNKVETNKELSIIRKIVEENCPIDDNDKDFITEENNNYHYTILSYQKIYGPRINESGGNIITILGNSKIIITEDDFLGKEIYLNINMLLGETEIYTPENTEIINRAISLLGNISIDKRIRCNKDEKKNKLIVAGTIILGDLSIKINKK